MKRWFIAKVVDVTGDGDFAPKTYLYTKSLRVWTKPGFSWCFGQLAASDLTAINADAEIYVLPDGALDMSVGSIPAGVRTTMRSRLEAAGFTFADVKTSWTVRQLLVYLLRQLQPSLDSVEQGDVQDVEQ